MQQPPYEQWQQPPWQPQPTQYYQQPYVPPPVYVPVSLQPSYPQKNTTMKTLSILSFVGFAVLIGLGILASEGAAGTTVLGLLGCTGLIAFVAGFIFLCLIQRGCNVLGTKCLISAKQSGAHISRLSIHQGDVREQADTSAVAAINRAP